MSTMEPTRQIVSTDPFVANLTTIKNEIQAELDRTGSGCIVQKVWKSIGVDQHIVVVEMLTPHGSPISETLVLAIIVLIIAAIAAYVYVQSISFREDRYNAVINAWEKIWHDTVMGMEHKTVDEMIQWKIENAPEEYAKRPYWCPYCGSEFETTDQREAHVAICPEAPAKPPTPPSGWTPGAYMTYFLGIYGYRTGSIIQALTRILRRRQ